MSEIPAETSPVIVTNEEKPTLESPTKKASTSAPKWELAVREGCPEAIEGYCFETRMPGLKVGNVVTFWLTQRGLLV